MQVNTEQDPASARKFQVSGVPTTVFLDAQGDVVDRQPGFLPAKEFAAKMNDALENEAAFKRLRSEIKRKPNDVTLNRDLAMRYLKRGRTQDAQPLVAKVARLDPKNAKLPELYFRWGIAHAQAEQLEKAREKFLSVLAKYPKSDAADASRFNLAIVYRFLGKTAQARSTLQDLARKGNAPEWRERAQQALGQMQ